MSTPVTLTAGMLREGFCHSTWQNTFNEFVANMIATLPGAYTTFNFGDTTPAVDDRDKPWVRTVGGIMDRTYQWNGTELGWIAPHRDAAGGSKRIIHVGTAASVDLIDGGTAGTVTNSTGPFWEIDTTFAARMPVGVGTLTDSGTVLAVTNTGGNDRVTLTVGQMPTHSHSFTFPDAPISLNAGVGASGTLGGPGNTTFALQPLEETGNDEPFNNMPPYVAVYFLKRTARIYHKV